MENFNQSTIVHELLNNEDWQEFADDLLCESSDDSDSSIDEPRVRRRSPGCVLTRDYLDGPDGDFQPVFHMNKSTFGALISKLLDLGATGTAAISIEERVLIFLYIVANAATYRVTADHFQHSLSTVSRILSALLPSMKQLAKEVIRLPTDLRTPQRIVSSAEFYPHFRGCLGALDGTHIPMVVPSSREDCETWRNRKGFFSTNVLAVCSFDLRFMYVLPGWAGSAHDARVLAFAEEFGGFSFPPGHYYLADSGYACRPGYVTPYKQVKYHLREWQRGTSAPRDGHQLFNLTHARLRNCVERIFGVLKKRFRVLQIGVELPMAHAIDLIYGLCGLHNFIMDHSPASEFRAYEGGLEGTPEAASVDESDPRLPYPQAAVIRDRIRLSLTNRVQPQ